MRREIFNNKNRLSDIIDTFIFEIAGARDEEETCGTTKKIFNLFNRGKQQHLSFDIVALYNKYMLFLVPEEVTGLPGVSFVEGMVCGCVFIGSNEAIYNSIGMKPSVHYLLYDGTIHGLRAVVEEAINQITRTEEISRAGQQFVLEFLQNETVCSNLIKKVTNRPCAH
jgi:hypothetical protein